jgi:hypothetical protein
MSLPSLRKLDDICVNIGIVSAVQNLGTIKECLFAKSSILYDFAKRLRTE